MLGDKWGGGVGELDDADDGDDLIIDDGADE